MSGISVRELNGLALTRLGLEGVRRAGEEEYVIGKSLCYQAPLAYACIIGDIMKVTAFNGSPRRNGNTAMLLRAALAPIADAGIETELVQVGGTSIHGCRACMQCMARQDHRCAMDDDGFNAHMEKILASDGILIGSPSYFASVTAETKALIDRAGLVSVANGRALARKVGAAVAAQRRGGGVQVVNTINQMFLMNRMIVPGSTYWNFGVGLDRGDVGSDQEALANMQDLGETIAWLLPRMQG